MQTAICTDNRLAGVSPGVSSTSLLVSVLAHGLLLWFLQWDPGVPVTVAHQADSIVFHLVSSESTTGTGVVPVTEPALVEALPLIDTPSLPAPVSTAQDAIAATPQPVAVEQQSMHTAAPAALDPPPPVTVAVSQVTKRHTPKTAIVDASRPPARPVQPRRAVPGQSAAAKTLASLDAPVTLPLDSRQVPVRAAGFSITPSYAPEPVYPLLARRLGLEGVVTLRVTVAADGVADSVEVLASSGHTIFDRAAVDAVRNWLFRVTGVPEHPAAASLDVPVRFELN